MIQQNVEVKKIGNKTYKYGSDEESKGNVLLYTVNTALQYGY